MSRLFFASFILKKKMGTFFFFTKIFIVSICNDNMVNCPVCKNPLPFFRWATSLNKLCGAVGLVVIVKVKLIEKEI